MEEKRKAITQVFGGIIVGINKYIMKVWNELAQDPLTLSKLTSRYVCLKQMYSKSLSCP